MVYLSAVYFWRRIMKKTDKIRQNLFPLLAAFIWGTAFVAQSVSTDFVEPFTFNTLRSVIAFFTLLIVSTAFSKVRKIRGEKEKVSGSQKDLIIGGICCGIFLCIASNLQQLGLGETSAGKAGFITALYVVLVPVFSIFAGKKAPLAVWASVCISVVGLYLLCIKENFTIQRSDFYIFLCAVVFAMHILCIDRFVAKTDGIKLSCVQFLTVAVISGVCTMIFENPDWGGILHCILPILYVGVFSSGVAYTLQILAQKDSDPTVVTILLSLESVFSVLAGAVILGDRLSAREYLGCILMFAAVILAQIPMPVKKKKAC